jgi:hypothetical protein
MAPTPININKNKINKIKTTLASFLPESLKIQNEIFS